jgi:hypothetical protein
MIEDRLEIYNLFAVPLAGLGPPRAQWGVRLSTPLLFDVARQLLTCERARILDVNGQMLVARDGYLPRAFAMPRSATCLLDRHPVADGFIFESGTEGSNPPSSSRQSVSAVNAEAVRERPRTLAAFCVWLGT